MAAFTEGAGHGDGHSESSLQLRPRAAAMRLWWGAGPQPGWRERAAETGQGDFPSSILASSWSKNAGLGGAGLSSEPGLVQGWVCNLGRCCTRGDLGGPETSPPRGERQGEGGLSLPRDTAVHRNGAQSCCSHFCFRPPRMTSSSRGQNPERARETEPEQEGWVGPQARPSS